MTASKNAQLCHPVGDLIAREVLGLSVKDAARMLDTSLPMVRRLRQGSLSSVPILLKAIEQFGVRILEPIIGRFDDESLFRRLDAIQSSLDEVRNARVAASSAPSSAHRYMGAAGRGRGLGQAQVCETSGGADGAVSIIRIRRPLDDIAGPDRENLRRQVSDWRDRRGVFTVEGAIAYAKSDNQSRLGVAIRQPGSAWKLAHIAAKNPLQLVAQKLDETTAREFDQLAAEPKTPWLLDTGATFVRDGRVTATSNWVCRTLDRAKDGTSILIAGFTPKAA